MTTKIKLKKDVIVLDVETTGFSSFNDEVTEIAMVKLDGETLDVIGSFSTLIKIENEIPKNVQAITGITKEMCDKHGVEKLAAKEYIHHFIKDCILVAHNASFDLDFLNRQYDIDPEFFYDTLAMVRYAEPKEKSHKLGDVCKRRGISLEGAHRAMNDVLATVQLFKELLLENVESKKMYNVLDKRARYKPTHTRGAN